MATCMMRLDADIAETLCADDPDTRISLFMKRFCESFCARRSYLFEMNARGTYDCSYEWCAPGASRPSHLRDLSESAYSGDVWDAFRAGESFAVSNVDALRERDAYLADLLASRGTGTVVLTPVPLRGELHGFIGLDDPASVLLTRGAPVMRLASLFVSAELVRREEWSNASTLSRRDPVTGLLNTTGLARSIDAAVRSVREGRTLHTMAVVYLDVANFKSFNRTFGYQGGDALLQRLADLLEAAVGTEYVCRADADRFFAVVDDDRAEALVDEVHDRMREDAHYSVNVVGGIYTIDGTETSAAQVLDRARIAGGAVRKDFVHCWRRYTPEMETRLTIESYVSTHVNEAVDEGWIRAYLQPVVGTFSGKVEGFEALARWDDPTYGMLTPAIFVDVLERTRQAYLIDFAVLDRVCTIIEGKRRAGAPFVPVSVNLSRFDLELPDVHDRIDRILAAHRVPHSALHFEITESALVDNEDLIAGHIAEFHKRGYEVWLDDFGSGYSSLNTLHRFDFDCVKLDMLFLRSETKKSRMLVGDLIDMAKHLGLCTLAEGAETEEQFRFLKSCGCALVQGYWCARPLPLAEAEENLARRGLSYMTPAEMPVYRDIALVDVRGGHLVQDPEAGPTDRNEGVAVLTEHDDKVGVAFANRFFALSLEEDRLGTVDDIVQKWNGGSSAGWRLRYGLHALQEVGQARTFALSDDGPREATVRLQLVSERPWGRAYLVEMHLAQREATPTTEDLFSMVSPLIAELWVVDPAADRFTSRYSASGANANEQLPKSGSFADAMRRFARESIYPLDVDEFLAFTDAATMGARVEVAPRKVVSGFFRVNVGGTAFELRRVTLSSVPARMGAGSYLLCVMTDAAGWTQPLLEHARLGSAAQESDLSVGELWNATLTSATSGVFWKDADRRFLGANGTFLRYYGLELADIVGKNDEDMGWHPDPEPFKKDELRVLRQGAIVSNVAGTCVVRGRVRAIVTTKVPVYRGERIVGLLGRFYDVAGQMRALSAVGVDESSPLRIPAYTDGVTDLPNANGFYRLCQRYVSVFANEGTDFGFVPVQILGARSLMSDLGGDVFEDLQRAIARALSQAVPEGVVGRTNPSRYALAVSPCDDRRLADVRLAAARSLASITEVDGMPCTVYALMGGALYSESADFGEMTAAAESRFAPADEPASETAAPAAGPVAPAEGGVDLRIHNERLRRENAALMRESRTDELTQLLNRRGFDEMADRLFSQEAADIQVWAVDIDNFKLFNDRFGHPVGDALLVALAEELQGLFGKGHVSRFGGDEFQAIVIDPTDETNARIACFFAEDHAFEAKGERYAYRCCAGFAHRDSECATFSELCSRADTALYHAKLERGGAFEYRASMEGDMRSMLGFSLADLCDGIPAAAFIYRDDPTEEVLFANNLCAQLFGCETVGEFMGLCDGSFRGIVVPEELDRVEESIRRQTEGGESGVRDFVAYHIERADGSRVRVLDAGRLVDNVFYGRLFFVLLINAELVGGWME